MPGLSGDAHHRDLGFVAVERDAGDDRLFHVLVFLERDERARAPSTSGSSNDDSTRSLTLYLPANSTERICSTFEPRLAISSISSNVMRVEAPRLGHDARIGRVDAVDVGVDLALVGLERGGERDAGRVGAAAAERRDVAVGVDALEAGDDDDRARRRGRARMSLSSISRMRALVYALSVRTRTWPPV